MARVTDSPATPVDDPRGDPEQLRRVVADLLGRAPMGEFEVVLARPDGTPAVLRNAPLLDDGRPMPTTFWLADPALSKAIGTLEADGGVKAAEAEIPAGDIEATHRRADARRTAELPPGHDGPAPSGGVGGTRQGVKCLHAHYANWLAGDPDPIGNWVDDRLRAVGRAWEHARAQLPEPPPSAGEGP